MAIALDQLPTRRDEAWKWTDLRAAVSEDLLNAAHAGEMDTSRAANAVAPLDRQPSTGMPALAAAIAGSSSVFELENDETLNLATLATGGHAIIGVVVGEGVRGRVVETYALDQGAFANVAIRYEVHPGASLERIVVAPADADSIVVSIIGVELAENAAYTQTTLTTGAKLARLETHVQVNGPDAEVNLNGVSLLAGDRHADHTTVVTHANAAPGAVTRETFRTVAADRSTGVFQGKIKVEREAQKTDAEMNHAALLLGENATVNAKPELEIYADDVACAHGATAGDLDAAAMFYMRQRGLPEAKAKALLTRAFIAEALANVSDDGVRAVLDQHVDQWLEANL